MYYDEVIPGAALQADLQHTVQSISDAIWNPMAYIVLGLGVIFTIAMKGVQFRRIPDMLRQLRDTRSGGGGLSSFQALVLALSSRVGVGSIAGVATAIFGGGPGALLWMAVTGLVGCTVGYAEATLSQVFKRHSKSAEADAAGEDIGGMPYYIRYGLNIPIIGGVVAVMGLVGYGLVFPGLQVSSIATSFNGAFHLPAWVSAVFLVIVMTLVIFGGTVRIIKVAQILVPVLAISYLLLALGVIAMHITQVPDAIVLIFRSAFGMEPVLAGIMGAAISWGVRRAVFASSNGLGEATFTAAAARTSHPVKQGLVQTFSIYIDVLLICMATGLMMVVSGKFSVDGHPGATEFTKQNIAAGPRWVQESIDSAFGGWGAGFVAIAVLFFGFTCLLAYYYVANSNLLYLLGGKDNKIAINILRAGTILIVFFGSVINAQVVWAVGDIGLGLIAWINLVCLAVLFPLVYKVYKDYERQRKLGLDPTFEPKALGIKHADFWEGPDPMSVQPRREVLD